MKQLIILIALLIPWPVINAQSHLDGYIKYGLDNNQSIKQQSVVLEKSLYALKEAKTLFLPTVAFNATYTKAGGGRTVDFPAGDILNPVYSTLNALTGTTAFPQLSNQSILLNPDNFYDIKFRTSMPLVNAEIYYLNKIKREQVNLQQLEVGIYKRELVKDIKKAYYQYLQAKTAIGIYQNALKMVEENKKVNTSLFNNGSANRTVVLRADNEVVKINNLIENARNAEKNARAYFNFLLNKQLDSGVEVDSIDATQAIILLNDTNVSRREELGKLSTANTLNNQALRLSKSYIIPKLNTFVDLGSQSFDWKFNDKSRYYFFGVSLDWNLFSSGRNSYKIKQAQADVKILDVQTDYVESQLKLQLNNCQNDYASAVNNYNSAKTQLNTAEKYYGDMLKLYKAGQALYIELLDAQNQLLNAQLQVNISLCDVMSKKADVERANGSFNLNN